MHSLGKGWFAGSAAALIGFFMMTSGCGGGGGGSSGGGGGSPPPPPPPPTLTVTTHTGTATNGAAYRARILNLGARSLAWDSSRNTIYAAVTSSSTLHPTSITSIDPVNPAVLVTQTLTSAARRIRLSDDNQYLFASLDSEGKVERRALTDLHLDATIAFGPSAFDASKQLYANDFAPAPGNPHVLAVALADPAVSPHMRAVTVYDDAVARPVDTHLSSPVWAIAWSPDATTLHGFTNEISPSSVLTIAVDSNGATVTGGVSYGFFEPAATIDHVGGALISSAGEVLRASTVDRLGYYAVPEDSCLFAKPLPGDTLILAQCVADADPNGSFEIRSFDLQNFTPVSTFSVSGLSIPPGGVFSSVIRWGTNGLAFMTPGDQIVLIDGDALTSTTPATVPPPAVTTIVADGVSAAGAAYTLREIDVNAYDLASDPTRGLIYVSIPGESNFAPNTIAALDPVSGLFTQAVPAGSEPNSLAVSADGQYLYAGIDGASSIERFRLDTFAVDRLTLLGHNVMGPYFAHWIGVAPGQPQTIAVARSVPFRISTTPSDGAVIIDDLVPRSSIAGVYDPSGSTSFPNGPRTAVAQWGVDTSTLYGGDTETSAADVSVYSVDTGGAHFVSAQPAMESHFFTQSGGLLYFGNGKTIDPSTGTAVSVTDLGLGVPGDGPVIVDEPLNTVFYLEQVGGLDDPWYLVVIATRGASAARDTITYRQPSSQDFVGRFPYAFVRYGAHGIAFLASNGRLFLLESDAIGAP